MGVWAIAACCAAAGAGAFGSIAVRNRIRGRRRLAQLRASLGFSGRDFGQTLASTGLVRTVMRQVLSAHVSDAGGAAGGFTGDWPAVAGRQGRVVQGHREGAAHALERYALRQITAAGLAETVSVRAYANTAAQLAILGGATGAVLGSVFTLAAAAFFGLVGLAVGALAVPWAFRSESAARVRQMEIELPDMLEIVALGLRSGSTFDLSFKAYADYFATPFAQACGQAYRRWSLGLCSRAQALQDLADSYESAEFSQVVASIIQALKLGSSLERDLAQAARRARQSYKAKREEDVARAPVKMMIPIGALILPAMLLLVLGPVILELISGF